MSKRRLGWKFAAVLMMVLTLVTMIRPGRSGTVGIILNDILSVVCAIALLQYAFGWPRLPRIWWRIIGPTISLILIGKGASLLGWLATRLAIRPLTLSEQIATSAAILVLVGYSLMLIIPLLRLGQWQTRLLAEPADKARNRLGTLEHTFS